MSTEKHQTDVTALAEELSRTQHQVDQLTLELQDTKNRLHQLVDRDGLSGLYNRRYFRDTLDKELERSQRYATPLSILSFEIDDFAQICRTCGEENAELVLMNIARVVEREMRPSDIVARYHQQTFTAILPETNRSGAQRVAERLCQAIRNIATMIKKTEVRATISAGSATAATEPAATTSGILIDTAQKALARARRRGSDQIEITDTID